MPLRLLHLSDIHFSAKGWDESRDQRNELLRDLAVQVETDGRVDAVLVGGDIAFSAQPDEYAIALDWIDQVLRVGGALGRPQVYTVPGNHDVNRAAVASSLDAMNFRLLMATCEVESVDFNLKNSFSDDPEKGRELLAPLSEYNEFALGFACAITAESPQWVDETTLNVDGWPVRLTGITSVLNSGAGNERGTLVVGCQQCRLERKDGVVDIVMMHHPPGWIRDWGRIEPYMNRAHLWIFGHEHAFAARQPTSADPVEVSAGAVAPERDRAGEVLPYVAAYNIIELVKHDENVLRISIHPRRWDLQTTRFALHPEGKARFDVSLLRASTDAATDHQHSSAEGAAAVPLAQDLESVRPDDTLRASSARQDLRRIGVRYLGLPVSKRREIGRSLGVLDDNDLRLPSSELYPLILRRIRDRDLIDQLNKELTNDA